MWFPALGINRGVSFFSCSNNSYPGNVVYRWGCAGSNNVYLFGHAHSVFKPLHDAYVNGRLRKGMKVSYADSKGKVRTYKLIWWKVTTPTNGGFAFAAQSRPSLTLQTCVGAKSQYRLIVRFVQVWSRAAGAGTARALSAPHFCHIRMGFVVGAARQRNHV